MGTKFNLLLAGTLIMCGCINPFANVPGDAESLTVAVLVPDSVQGDEHVTVDVQLTNNASRRAIVHSPSTQPQPLLDVVVTGEAGEVVWRRFEDVFFNLRPSRRTIAPNETIEVTVVWDQVGNDGTAVSLGRYEVRAELLLTDSRPIVSEARSFAIVSASKIDDSVKAGS